MITTREINVILKKGQRKLKGITTKTVDASIRLPLPIEKKIKSPIASTHNIADVKDIAEKKLRDEIMAQRKASMIMAETVEQGKDAIEALKTDLNNAMEEDKKKEILAIKEQDEIEEKAAIYQEINERKARESKELALKKKKEKEAKAAVKKKADKERMAKVRAAKKDKK